MAPKPATVLLIWLRDVAVYWRTLVIILAPVVYLPLILVYPNDLVSIVIFPVCLLLGRSSCINADCWHKSNKLLCIHVGLHQKLEIAEFNVNSMTA
jgi:hypothetical protein